MLLKSRYDIGQSVWVAQQQYEPVRNACKLCHGKGMVQIVGSEKLAVCPECKGRGYFDGGAIYRWVLGIHSVVGQINIKAVKTPKKGIITTVEYMLRDSGIGSGSIWKEDQLFLTKEEAEAYCDKMNELESSSK